MGFEEKDLRWGERERQRGEPQLFPFMCTKAAVMSFFLIKMFSEADVIYGSLSFIEGC